MTLPLSPPVAPMEALSVGAVQVGADWQYEPKWDGFRCILFRDSSRVEIQSKSGKPLTRYFPELAAAAHLLAAKAFVLDGELMVLGPDGPSFDALLQRIHPAQTRVNRLAEETPASVIVFDLLCGEDRRSLLDRPLRDRRNRLEAFAKRFFLRRKRLPAVARDH